MFSAEKAPPARPLTADELGSSPPSVHFSITWEASKDTKGAGSHPVPTESELMNMGSGHLCCFLKASRVILMYISRQGTTWSPTLLHTCANWDSTTLPTCLAYWALLSLALHWPGPSEPSVFRFDCLSLKQQAARSFAVCTWGGVYHMVSCRKDKGGNVENLLVAISFSASCTIFSFHDCSL